MANTNQNRPRRPGRPAHGAGPVLTRMAIVDEALRLADEEGAQAVTMRRLAARLGVEAMSLYAHIGNKEELLAAVADRVASELPALSLAGLSWQYRIRTAVWAWAGMQRAHPGAFPLLYRRRAGTDRERAVTEELMGALMAAGFDDAGVALAYQTLVSFLDGALLHWPPQVWNASGGWQQVALHIDAARFPVVAQIAPHAAQLSWETVFSEGLELLLRGLEVRASDTV